MATANCSSNELAAILAKAIELADLQRFREAVDLLDAAVRRTPDSQLEEALVRLRHAAVGPAGAINRAVTDQPWPRSAPDQTGTAIPEVQATDLTVDHLTGALAQRGSLIVRGWLSPDVAEALRRTVATALCEAHTAIEAGRDQAPPWFVPFEAHESYEFGLMDRAFTRYADSLLTVESPRALARVLAAMADTGIGDLLQEYFGEWPVLSAKKSTLRRASRQSPRGWHQDGAFLGSATRTVNTWIALTPCGIDAPGIDMVVHAFDDIVPTGTDGAPFPWSVGDAVVERLGMPVERPVFEAGDALFFNQMSLHRSGIEPTMTCERIAIESWFFAPSTCPSEQIPILF